MIHTSDNSLLIDGTIFSFPNHWKVTAFDEWPQFKKPAGELGLQGCDVLALEYSTLWIIEMKDYTYLGANQPGELPKTVGQKAAGTMALLYALQRNPSDSKARRFALECSKASRIHLALHIDVKDGGRKERHIKPTLMPIKTNLKKAEKALGLSKSYVTSTLAPDASIPWEARRDPTTREHHRDR